MTPRPSWVTPLVLIAGLFAGCGSDDPAPHDSSTPTDRGSESDESDKNQEDRDGTVGTDDFSFIPPQGWLDVTDEASAPVVLQFGDPDSAKLPPPNVNVVRIPGEAKLSTSDLETAVVSELQQLSPEFDIEVGEPYDLDGVDAPVIVVRNFSDGDLTYITRQYFGDHDGARFVVTFAFPHGTSDSEMIRTSESVIDSWQWTR